MPCWWGRVARLGLCGAAVCAFLPSTNASASAPVAGTDTFDDGVKEMDKWIADGRDPKDERVVSPPSNDGRCHVRGASRRGRAEVPPFCGRLWYKWAAAEPDKFAAVLRERGDAALVTITTRNIASEYEVPSAVVLARALEPREDLWEAAMQAIVSALSPSLAIDPDGGDAAAVHEIRHHEAGCTNDPARTAGAMLVLAQLTTHYCFGYDSACRKMFEWERPSTVFPEPITVDAAEAFFHRQDAWRLSGRLCRALPAGARVSTAIEDATKNASRDGQTREAIGAVANCLCARHDRKARTELATFFAERGAADRLSTDQSLALQLREPCR